MQLACLANIDEASVAEQRGRVEAEGRVGGGKRADHAGPGGLCQGLGFTLNGWDSRRV